MDVVAKKAVVLAKEWNSVLVHECGQVHSFILPSLSSMIWGYTLSIS